MSGLDSLNYLNSQPQTVDLHSGHMMVSDIEAAVKPQGKAPPGTEKADLKTVPIHIDGHSEPVYISPNQERAIREARESMFGGADAFPGVKLPSDKGKLQQFKN